MVATSGRFVDDDLQDEVDNTLSALYELPLTSQLVSPMLHTVSEVWMRSYTTVLCSPRRSCITVLLLTGRSCRALVSHVSLIPAPYTTPVNCFACFNATAISLCVCFMLLCSGGGRIYCHSMLTAPSWCLYVFSVAGLGVVLTVRSASTRVWVVFRRLCMCSS